MRAPSRDPAVALDPRTYARGLACVHCGLCLPACPTYTQNGNEADSPRGRIALMLGLADGRLDPTPGVVRHLDLCLDCRACETACPSGVVYHELIEETRARLAARPDLVPQPVQNRLLKWLFFHVLTHPTRLKAALLPARLMQRIGLYALLRRTGVFGILPAGLRKMEQMLPPEGALWPARMAERFAPPTGVARKAVVAFIPGCIGSVMFDRVNRMAVELLTAAGAEVVVPRGVRCCGAIQHHNNDHGAAGRLARQNIAAIEPVRADVVALTIAGCGASMREYDHLLRDDPAWSARAAAFSSKVRDVSEVLVELGLPDLPHTVDETATYHDACHLLHAQKVSAAPRELLAKVRGLKLVALPESDMCCGAAGTYNLTQPEMATQLGDRKVRHIASTGASLCATGNVGCALHIQGQAAAARQALRVAHPVEILHRAAFGERP
jgi:glycolate oxidase iron-sulfur subunit